MVVAKGMNVAEMKNLLTICKREANSIRGVVSTLNATVDYTWWQGGDADKFREVWRYEDRRRLLELVGELDRLAQLLSREISQQIATSGN